MNFANNPHLVSLIVFCGVAVLVIVTGQSTTDDDIDKDEISRHIVEVLRAELREELRAELGAEFRAELARSTDAVASLKSQVTSLQSQLGVSLDEIAKLKNKGKEKTICMYYKDES